VFAGVQLGRVVLETGTLSTFLYHGLVERGVAIRQRDRGSRWIIAAQSQAFARFPQNLANSITSNPPKPTLPGASAFFTGDQLRTRW
ncbi:hypothetical protein, partial [Novosphingobium sp. Rr 2-17]|uniref:hypothetical protein n=1 Tax=Novosphingobium sp. Rr 2-17 TaxID=555793 RepID=UPI001ED8E791